MFLEDVTTFTDLSYGVGLLTLLYYCMKITHEQVRRGNDGMKYNENCLSSLFNQREKFYRAMWDKRYLIQQDVLTRVPDASDFRKFPIPAMRCVLTLHEISDGFRQRTTLSLHAAHFLLYYWAHSPRDNEVTELMPPLEEILNHDAQHATPFVKDFLDSSPRDVPRLILKKASRFLRDKRFVGEHAYELTYVTTALVCNDTELFSGVRLPEGHGLVPSMIMNFHRHMCCSAPPSPSPRRIKDLSGLLIESFRRLLNTSNSHQVTSQITRYAGELNLISIVGLAAIYDVKETRERDFETTRKVLELLSTFVRLPENDIPPLAEQQMSIRRTTERVWHDTLKDILSIRTSGVRQLALKNAVLRAWRSYGGAFSLREGVDVTTCRIPSTPSNLGSYWLIPKRCFLNSCPCSATMQPCHHLRVCKGCWRVLYCSPKCQSLDWKAGHRRVCRTLS